MDGFIALVKGVFEFLNLPITIWGYTVTFWHMFVAIFVVTAAGVVIRFFLGGRE